MCWKLETILPSAPWPLPPTMRSYHLLTMSNPRLCSAILKILTTSITDRDRKCSVLVGWTDRRLLYQWWKTDEISFGGGQDSRAMCLNSGCSWYPSLPFKRTQCLFSVSTILLYKKTKGRPVKWLSTESICTNLNTRLCGMLSETHCQWVKVCFTFWGPKEQHKSCIIK